MPFQGNRIRGYHTIFDPKGLPDISGLNPP
jgi:hypothetical protein